MLETLFIAALLLVLPWVLSALHCRYKLVDTPLAKTIRYYRYFLLFNLFIYGGLVAGRFFYSSWYMPTLPASFMQLYAIAVLSMLLLALFTLFRSDALQLAGAIQWSFFLLLSLLIQLRFIWAQPVNDDFPSLIYAIYNIFVLIGLAYFIQKLKQRKKQESSE